jgi:catechol 2,3-dioxygenase-like lactoylglutathione lyase family enzyme
MSRSPQVLRHAPYFPVADLERATDHYQRVLGFHRDYVGGSPAEFAILSRDGQAVMLRVVPDPQLISPNERQGGRWDVFFWVRDARELHGELTANGAEVVYGPVIQDAYGMLEFAVRDGEGYVLGFGQALDGTGGD